MSPIYMELPNIEIIQYSKLIHLLWHLCRYVLENYANMSSPTILFVLDKLLEDAQNFPSESIHLWTVVIGFGPGLTIEGILLKKC